MIHFTSSNAVIYLMFCSAVTGIYLSDRMQPTVGVAEIS